jgi:antibiotic biosynthesis monooxygenase (ABM) superfamily enzyme
MTLISATLPSSSPPAPVKVVFERRVLTWVVMPALTRLLYGWLYPEPRK